MPSGAPGRVHNGHKKYIFIIKSELKDKHNTMMVWIKISRIEIGYISRGK